LKSAGGSAAFYIDTTFQIAGLSGIKEMIPNQQPAKHDPVLIWYQIDLLEINPVINFETITFGKNI